MKKLSEILRLIDLFYKKAFHIFAAEPQTWTMPDDEVEDSAPSELTGNIYVDYESIDLKNAELASLLDAFVTQHNLIIESFNDTPDTLSNAGLSHTFDLYETFKRMYEKLLSHAYLISPAFLINEDISPITLNKFIESVFEDVHYHIKKMEESGISEEEILQRNLPEEFNTQIELSGNAAAEQWSANRIAKQREARQEYFSNMRNDPKKYASFLAKRREYLANMIAALKQNPEQYTEYKNKIKNRVSKVYAHRAQEINNILLVYKANAAKIGLLPLGHARNKLLEENAQLKERMTVISKHLAETKESSFHVARDQYIQKRKDIKESNTLMGANLIFKQKAQTAKSDVKKKLLKNVDLHPTIIEVRQKIEAAFIDYKRDPSPDKRTYLESLQKLDKKLKDDLTSVNPIFIQTTADIDELEFFRKIVDQIVKTNEFSMPRQDLLNMGQELLDKYSKEYKSVGNALFDVLEYLRRL